MYNGVINIYKEKGYTSHDVVAKLRGILKQKKIGHTGTLDPDAEGVLLVCLGHATKLCDMLTDKTKTYQTVCLLGIKTDTQDITGKVISEKKVDSDKQRIVDVTGSFEGEYMQIPPMYSALKHNGKKLYELARKGIEVERPARKTIIHEIKIDSIELPRITMTVTCSKGTYIRTLCHDIGEILGCGGCMESLMRTRVGIFDAVHSMKLSEVETLRDEGHLEEHIIKTDDIFTEYPFIKLVPEGDRFVHNGNQFSYKLSGTTQLFDIGYVKVYDSNNEFIGIYEYDKEKQWYRPVKLFIGG